MDGLRALQMRADGLSIRVNAAAWADLWAPAGQKDTLSMSSLHGLVRFQEYWLAWRFLRVQQVLPRLLMQTIEHSLIWVPSVRAKFGGFATTTSQPRWWKFRHRGQV